MSENHRHRRRRGALAPNPRLWEALERGPKLRAILEDFYAQVYDDPRLSPFFVHTSMQWAIDHQYAFLAEIFSGEKLYFGDRPRNAHSWMVITNELFDHREALMESCLRRHGLDEASIAAWRAVEETFRGHIVKDAPIARKRAGIALPVEGYEGLELGVGTLCDECSTELPVGARAVYHVRTGMTYCPDCRTPAPSDEARA
jgi:truncated hemoglobin YjbI